jgi:hypothetical protein
MNREHVIGKLKVTKPERITESTQHNIWLALNKHCFFSIIEPALWEKGVLKVSSERHVMDGQLAATEFINKLAAVLIEDGIPELGLTGEITLVTTGDETSDNTLIHRILVTNNNVLYSQASLKWENYTVADTHLHTGPEN